MPTALLRDAGATLVGMSFRAKLAIALFMALSIACIAWLVFATGGVRFAYLHLMYVPIIVCGFAFGVPGGLLAGVVAGLLVGPAMPQDTDLMLAQEMHNWALRMFFFSLVGAVAGFWNQLLQRHVRELEWLHVHHEDTGLLNEAGLIRGLEGLIRSNAPNQRFAVSISQLDTFLEIQNTFGAGFGLRVLGQVVERAKQLVPSGSLVALIQPDRIATVIQEDATPQVTRERIEQTLKDSYLVDGLPIHVGASVGVAYFPEHACSPEALLQKASIAMHWAVSDKTGISVYDSANDRTSRDNLILLGALPEAIAQGELQVWHQAKLRLDTNTITGTEALLRWKHPVRGILLPGLFLPQAEETMLIDPITQEVIAQAFADAGTWRAEGNRLQVAVNLSMRNLRDHMLFDVIEQAARRHGLEASDIELEITESAVMAAPAHCIRLVAMLRERGYSVAIDDFGVGQSSLSYLQKLRVSTLKIDQDFIKTLGEDANNRKIVQTILQLAKSLGLRTVAEGIETPQALDLLREWGCDYGQGYWIHRPAPASDILHFLQERHSREKVTT
jgi:diguanylate cyclase